MADTTPTTYPTDTTALPEQTSTREDATSQIPVNDQALDEELLDDGLEEELIIEDFTIDGICGVY